MAEQIRDSYTTGIAIVVGEISCRISAEVGDEPVLLIIGRGENGEEFIEDAKEIHVGRGSAAKLVTLPKPAGGWDFPQIQKLRLLKDE